MRGINNTFLYQLKWPEYSIAIGSKFIQLKPLATGSGN